MIDKIGSDINFTSNILYNRMLDKGFNQAVINARTGKTLNANQFANAINYLINDGKDDVYCIKTMHSGYEPQNKVYLLKNGKIISSTNKYKKAGNNVIHLVDTYVKEEFHTDLNTPNIKNSYNAVKNSFSLINKYLENIKEQFSNDNKMTEGINDIQKKIAGINAYAKENGNNESRSELYVKKLREITQNIHYGEML